MSKTKRQAREAAARAKERRWTILVLALFAVALILGLVLHQYLFHREGAVHRHRGLFGERMPWGLSEQDTGKAVTNKPANHHEQGENP